MERIVVAEKAFVPSSMALDPNGRFLALSNVMGYQIDVFEKEGSQWKATALKEVH